MKTSKIAILSVIALVLILITAPISQKAARKSGSSSRALELEISEEFASWSQKHHRLYASPEDQTKRYANFKKNYLFIKSSNAKNKSYTLGLNETADLSDEEFRTQYMLSSLTEENLKKSTPISLARNINNKVKQSTVYSVNWQKEGKSNKPRTFDTCKVPNLFTAISIYESAWAIKRNNSAKKSSPQYVLDCMASTKGCRGDTLDSYLEFLYQRGTVDEHEYKWKDSLGKCPPRSINEKLTLRQVSPIKPYDDLKKYDSFTNFTVQELINFVQSAPMPMFIRISNSIRFYSQGIFKSETTGDCPNSGYSGLYVPVDGFSIDKSKNGYFLLKFPWGVHWGEFGNMRFGFKKGDNYTSDEVCGFYRYATRVYA